MNMNMDKCRAMQMNKCPLCGETDCNWVPPGMTDLTPYRLMLWHVWVNHCGDAATFCWCDRSKWPKKQTKGCSWGVADLATFDHHLRAHGGLVNHLAMCAMAGAYQEGK